jgi:hypothetical protein
MRYTKRAVPHFWLFGTTDGRDVTMLGFAHRDDRDMRYGQIQTCGTPWTTMGRTDRAVTKSRALTAMGERFPGCTVTVRYPADEAADEADARAEARAYHGR